MLFIPTENGNFHSQLDPRYHFHHFYKHAYHFCFIYDRYGVIEGKPANGVAYPIKINKDFQDGKYMTVVEVYPLPEMGFMPRSTKNEVTISGDGFIATEENVYCKQHDHILIYYSKDKLDGLELGAFGKIVATFDPEIQKYFLTSLNYVQKQQNFRQSLIPLIKFRINVKLEAGVFYANDFFGVISIKPYRRCGKDVEYITASYVRNDPKYQSSFAENEEYEKSLVEDDDDPYDF
uniref:Uncharacterized protein n=1 Tax=Panagrolaimus superbus TaxID=310955 RepID=A0A914YMI6_9BILA